VHVPFAIQSTYFQQNVIFSLVFSINNFEIWKKKLIKKRFLNNFREYGIANQTGLSAQQASNMEWLDQLKLTSEINVKLSELQRYWMHTFLAQRCQAIFTRVSTSLLQSLNWNKLITSTIEPRFLGFPTT